MNEKFFKALIYSLLSSILIIFFLIQPYNIFCRISKNCQPIILSSLIHKKEGKEKLIINFTAQIPDELKNILIFYPVKNSQEIINGKNIINYYLVKNLTDKKITIRAHYDIEPLEADKYLDKIECLCFKNQILEAFETVKMPINFRINSEMENDVMTKEIKSIEVSYEVELL